MSGWLDKRGGLEATKVNKISNVFMNKLMTSALHTFLCTEMEEAMVHPQQSLISILQEWHGNSPYMECNTVHVMLYNLQDSSPAGTIFAEDIVDVAADHEESKKDSKVDQLTNLLQSLCISLNAPSHSTA